MILISVRGWVDPRAIVQPKGLSEWKIPVMPSGIEPPTFQLVVWCLNLLAPPHAPTRAWKKLNILEFHNLCRVWGSVVVKALRYQSDSPGIDSRWCHWGFFPWLPLTEPCVLGLTQPLKMSTRDFSWGQGSRYVWLTTYHPLSTERQENPGP